MKILQVIPFFSPIHGGSAKSTYEISKWLSKRGHEVTIFTSDFKLSHEWIASLPQVRVCAFKTWSNLAGFLVTFDMVKNAMKTVGKFDIIHMHNYRTFQNIITAHYAVKYGVPYILQARGSLPIMMGKHQLKWVYDVSFGYRLLERASKVIALNEVEVNQYLNMGVSPEIIEVIPNGIDLSEYSTLPSRNIFKEKVNIDDNDKLVLFLGRIHKIKGIDFLIRAFANIATNISGVKLVISGPDDGYLPEVKSLISKLKLERAVFITGPLYGMHKLEAYVDSDVVVLPSRYETFPNIVLEAYACYKPVIASRTGSLPQLVLNGATGFLFENGDVEGLARNLEYLLNDSSRAERMGLEGRKFVEACFSYDAVINMFETLYTNTLR